MWTKTRRTKGSKQLFNLGLDIIDMPFETIKSKSFQKKEIKLHMPGWISVNI